MYYAPDISAPHNIRFQSTLTAVQAECAATRRAMRAERELEALASAYEARLVARFGLGRKSWEAPKVLVCAVCCALVAIGTGLLQIGGV